MVGFQNYRFFFVKQGFQDMSVAGMVLLTH